MKRYAEYMDSVEVSQELEARLLALKAPKARRIPVYRAAGIAAALAVAVGIGAWAAGPGSDATGDGYASDAPGYLQDNVEPEGPQGNAPDMPAGPDTPAPETPEDLDDSGNWIYVNRGETEPSEAFSVPKIRFANADDMPQVSADYALWSSDAEVRDVGPEDLEAIFGAGCLDYLGWSDEAELYGWVGFEPDGRASGAMLSATAGENYISVEILSGSEVPDCVVFADENGDPYGYSWSTWQGVELRAFQWPASGYAQVSFFAGGVGYKIVVNGNDFGELCARFVSVAVKSDGAFAELTE